MSIHKPTIIHFDGKRRFSEPSDGLTYLPDGRGEYHLPKLKQGSTMELDLEFRDIDDELVNFSELTDPTYEADFRANFADAAPEVTCTISTPTATTLRLRVEALAMSGLAATDDDERVWDVEVTYDDGGTADHVDRVASGTYKFTKEASKA